MKITRREYLTVKAMEPGSGKETLASMFLAMEAVASVAIEHPEWDMDEERTWIEWERELS